MATRVRILAFAAAALLLVAGVAGAAPERQVATLAAGAAGMEWQPRVGTYDRLVLTVSAPDGVVHRQEFAFGETPSFGLYDKAGAVRPAGTYRYELRVVPQIGAGLRREINKARRAGNEARAAQLLRQAGVRETVQSGSFAIADGGFVALDRVEAPDVASATGKAITNVTAADQVIPDDLIVQGSECVGLDCVNNENFGFDTIRLKENNLRIHFDDTSTQPGFPANDWRLIANDSASGGSSKFSIEDSTSAKTPFTITAGAATNSIFVDSTGRVGLRTSTPVLDLHINTSNTPAIRLEQNNSGGFTAQTWDIGANEANFFIRDVTGGSKLSLRIRPGAPTSSLDISADGDVGVGTASPADKLHVTTSNSATTGIGGLFENTNGTAAAREMLEIRNAGQTVMIFDDTTVGERWSNGTNSNNFVINNQGNPGIEYTFGPTGNAVAAGTFTPASSRAVKHGFNAVDPGEVLSKVLALPITSWSYNADPTVRHIGPVSEDFYAAFGVGGDQGISVTDSAGVALAAIQGLQHQIVAKDGEIAALKARLAALESAVAALAPRP